MKTLKDQQNDFSRFLLKSDPNTMSMDVVDTEPFNANRRLNVYLDAYQARLYEALKTDYPKIEVLIGEHDFYELCIAYIEAYPSHYYSLRIFGEGFESYLRTHKPYVDYPFLAEMANFEWSLMDSLDALNAKLFTVEQLKGIPPEKWAELILTFHPSVHRRTYQWDIPGVWKAIELEEPARSPIQLDAPEHWIFWRKGLQSMFASMNPAQIMLYQGFQEHLSLADIAEIMQEFYEPEDIPTLLVQNLQYWISEELFSMPQLVNS